MNGNLRREKNGAVIAANWIKVGPFAHLNAFFFHFHLTVVEDVFGTSVDISSSQQATTITHTRCTGSSSRGFPPKTNGFSQGEQVGGSDWTVCERTALFIRLIHYRRGTRGWRDEPAIFPNERCYVGHIGLRINHSIRSTDLPRTKPRQQTKSGPLRTAHGVW